MDSGRGVASGDIRIGSNEFDNQGGPSGIVQIADAGKEEYTYGVGATLTLQIKLPLAERRVRVRPTKTVCVTTGTPTRS